MVLTLSIAGCNRGSGDLQAQAHHPNGSIIRLTGFSSSNNTIRVSAFLTNGFTRPIQLNANKDCVVISSEGKVYLLQPAADNPRLRIAAGQTVKADLTFEAEDGGGGRSFTLVTNQTSGSSDSEQSDRPQFRIGFPVAEKPAREGLPKPISIDKQANHPNGAVVRVTQVAFVENGIQVSLVCTNGSSRAIELNGNRDLWLIDNLGNRYRPAENPENPKYSVLSGATALPVVAFVGRVHPNASSLVLVTNEKLGSADYEGSNRPQVRFEIPIGS